MTSGQRVNPVNMEATETRAANLVNILLKFILPRSIYANILIAAMLIKMEYYFYLRLVTQ
jgi:tRNA(Glu) U13 pseudouridine synthase TruD